MPRLLRVGSQLGVLSRSGNLFLPERCRRRGDSRDLQRNLWSVHTPDAPLPDRRPDPHRREPRYLPLIAAMKTRIKHSLYLTPAILLLFLWIACAPSFIAAYPLYVVLGLLVASAIMASWCIVLFAHALQRDKP